MENKQYTVEELLKKYEEYKNENPRSAWTAGNFLIWLSSQPREEQCKFCHGLEEHGRGCPKEEQLKPYFYAEDTKGTCYIHCGYCGKVVESRPSPQPLSEEKSEVRKVTCKCSCHTIDPREEPCTECDWFHTPPHSIQEIDLKEAAFKYDTVVDALADKINELARAVNSLLKR